MKKKATKGVLSDHHRRGKVLVPPMMQLPNLVETSFSDAKIPELIWISALFNWTDDRSAVNAVIEFQLACQKITKSDQLPTLSFLSNFDRLSKAQQGAINSDAECGRWIGILKRALWHQNALFERYPLAFIFQAQEDVDLDEALARIKKDVHELFDRRSHHATKVQTTAVIGMMATGKIVLNSSINFPDPNRVFDTPESSDARKVASVVRAVLNTGSNMDTDATIAARWVNDFWTQAYSLEECF
jgi:hypothetical protein